MRKATKIELETPIEIIKWSVISTQFRNIEKANLKKHGQSKDRGSMRFPEGIVHCVHHDDNCVEIHSCWRNTLKSMYLIK